MQLPFKVHDDAADSNSGVSGKTFPGTAVRTSKLTKGSFIHIRGRAVPLPGYEEILGVTSGQC